MSMSGHSPRSSERKRSAEGVADRRVGRRAASLRQNSLLAAEAHDVPDDEKVAGEVELADDGELVLELAAHSRSDAAVTLSGAAVGQLAQVADGRLSRRQGIVGKTVAEVGEGELALFGDAFGVGDRVGQVAEEVRHCRRRFQVPLGVLQQQPSGGVERGLLANAGEHVEERFAVA
jgi:hypothetical protein